MTVAIYARKSVERQDSVSIDTQIEECKTKVPKKVNIQVYQDEGFSGKDTARPDLQRLLEDIEMGLIQKVIVYKLDRISRNTVDFYNLYEFMKKHGCAFVSVNDGFDTSTREGRFLMGVLASFAEMERESIALRVKDSYYYRARNDGRWLGGRPPFGFDMGKTGDNKSTLIPNDKMKLVIDFYNKYCNDTNTSLHQLVSYARENFDVKLSATQVRNILSNPLYAQSDKRLYDFYKLQGVQFLNGIEQFDGTRALQIVNKTDQSQSKTVFNDTTKWIAYLANWNGIIDSRTFIIVQERLSQNKAYASSNKSTNKFEELSGLVKCAKCGMSIKRTGRSGTFSCIGRSEYRGHCNASFAGIRLPDIQEQVAEEMQKYFKNFASKQQEEIDKRNRIRDKIKKTTKELDRLLTLAEQSETLQQATIKRIEQKQNELIDLELQLTVGVYDSDKIESRVLHSVNLGPATLFSEIDYRRLTTERKQALLRITVNKILLSEDGTIEIVWKE